MYKVCMVSLGCPKNQVDAEMMLSLLKKGGLEICSEEAEADAIIINTCGFIEDAKSEAIENILEAAEYKQNGKCKALIVTGCLAERYRDDVTEEITPSNVLPIYFLIYSTFLSLITSRSASSALLSQRLDI